MVVDCYHETAVMQLKTPGAMGLCESLVSFLSQKGFKTILERREKSDDKVGGDSIFHKGTETEPEFTEHGIKFIADITKGQKTGFF